MTVFSPEDRATFAANYPEVPHKLHHRLGRHPLLELDALATLAETLPAGSIEYNKSDLPIGITEKPGASGLTIGDTIRRIEQTGSWAALKNIEQVPAYAALLADLLAEIRPEIEARTGRMMKTQGFVFITSPNGVTPYHFDPEHNILLQIQGSKVMTVFPVEDEDIFAAPAHEAFHLGQHHRNLPWRDDFAAKGQSFQLNPGEALHVPVKRPHWVQNGDAPSVSLSVTWRSEWSYAEADARAFNSVLRRIGLQPHSPTPFPGQNRAKALAYRAIRKVRG